MKRSACVNLVLLGSAVALSGCDSATHELQQQLSGAHAAAFCALIRASHR